jgi:hypothetical protein
MGKQKEYNMFGDIYKYYKDILIASLILLPLSIWKISDIAIWIFNHFFKGSN